MRRAATGIAGLVCLLAGGCGTLKNHAEPGGFLNFDGSSRPHRLYGGVRVDGELIVKNAS